MTRIPAGGRLGRYQIERMLGQGAMGEVYLAEDPQIGRRVAIKTVRVEEGKAAEVEERKRRLLREARAAGRLLHPNVVALFDAGEDQGVLYLAFECVEGMDLAQRLEQSPPLTLREVIQYVRQAADGLDYAHRQGIVHRDIKPSNLLLGPNGQIKVSDFGIAKLAEQTSELTMTGSVVGSPHYLSPEQIRGDELDGRSDIFSLGVLFYEVLSRQRPFTGETLTTLVYQILHRDPPSIVVSRPELGTRLESVLQRMLHKDRNQRFASAGEVARALVLCEQEIAPAVLDRSAAPPDAPPLDGTRRMSTSERAADVTPTAVGALPPPPPPPAPPPAGVAAAASPTSNTELLAERSGSGSGTAAKAPSSSKTALVAIAAVVGVLLVLLVVGGLAARRWAASKLKTAKSEVTAITEAPATTNTAPATEPPASPAATPLTTTPAQEPEAPATPPGNADDPGKRFQQETRPEVPQEPATQPATTPVRPVPERPKGPAAEPPAATQQPATRPPVTAPAVHEPEPEPEPAATEDEEPEPTAPLAERPGIAPQIDRVVMTGMALSFVVEPEDAIVKVDNRVIGQAWTWNAKKKEGRAYDLPDPGDHLVRILANGRTYTIRVVASEGAPSPTIIAVDLEGGAKSGRRKRAGDKP